MQGQPREREVRGMGTWASLLSAWALMAWVAASEAPTAGAAGNQLRMAEGPCLSLSALAWDDLLICSAISDNWKEFKNVMNPS